MPFLFWLPFIVMSGMLNIASNDWTESDRAAER